ncbi:MAG: PQQ-binding-like beta-propeller repeat protein [Phycisphaerae bacterium]
MRYFALLLGGTVLACASWALADDAQPSKVIGWRGDGTGRYPQADPPTEWGLWPRSPLHGMRFAIDKPKDSDTGQDARTLIHNQPKEWLIIGPFDAAKDDPLDKDYIADEAKLSPSAGDKAGELEWKPIALKKREGDALQGTELDWTYFGDLTGNKNDKIAYGHVYLYSPMDGKAVLVLDHGGALKAWLNGQEVYRNPKANLSIWAMNNISWAMETWAPLPFGVRAQKVTVSLNKGWNRLLLKASGNVHLRLTVEPGTQYESKNIAWSCPLPDNSNASPVIVGDKVFVMAEPDELVCVDKKDGKVLWRRSNSYFDAVSEKDRAANEAFKKIGEMTDLRMAATTYGDKLVLRKRIQDALEALDWDGALPFYESITADQREKDPGIAQKIDPLVEKLKAAKPEEKAQVMRQLFPMLWQLGCPAKYTMIIEGHPTSHRPLGGWTTPTPVTDGKLVYVWVTNDVAACYDLDGNRKWIRRVDLDFRWPGAKYGAYGYPCSPVLIGGKFIVSTGHGGTAAINAADGSLAWKLQAPQSTICQNAATIGGVDVVISSDGQVLRVSDGKTLWTPQNPANSGPGTLVGGILYNFHLHFETVDFTKCTGDAWKPAVTPISVNPGTVYASPLFNDGLVYAIDREGALSVVDLAAGKLAYKQKIDFFAPMLHYNACGVGSAPTLGGKYVYLMDNQGHCLVMEPGREFKPVARNAIERHMERDYPTNPQETVYSNPVFEGTSMYVRAEGHLYRIQTKE